MHDEDVEDKTNDSVIRQFVSYAKPHLPGYTYCGLNNGTGQPINALDAACLDHDNHEDYTKNKAYFMWNKADRDLWQTVNYLLKYDETIPRWHLRAVQAFLKAKKSIAPSMIEYNLDSQPEDLPDITMNLDRPTPYLEEIPSGIVTLPDETINIATPAYSQAPIFKIISNVRPASKRKMQLKPTTRWYNKRRRLSAKPKYGGSGPYRPWRPYRRYVYARRRARPYRRRRY